MNIDDIPAGKHLNDQVAIEVMRWKKKPWGPVDVFEGDGCAWPDWNPSERIDHAWKMVEKLKLMVFPTETGWAACRADEHGDHHISHGDLWIDGHIDHIAYAPTAPLAICYSALSVVRK